MVSSVYSYTVQQLSTLLQEKSRAKLKVYLLFA